MSNPGWRLCVLREVKIAVDGREKTAASLTVISMHA